MNGSSDPWVWLNGVRSNMHGIIYERAAKWGEQIDASAPAIYPTHVDKISEALMKEGSDHSAIVNITQRPGWCEWDGAVSATAPSPP